MTPSLSDYDSAETHQFGLGLRTPFYDEALQGNTDIDFYELLSENYMVPGGKPIDYLDAFAERFPLVLHGVSLSIGSDEEPSRDYLGQLKRLARRSKALWVSDHLCWTGLGGTNSHDLLPLSFSYEALERVVKNIHIVQNELEQSIVLENISTYARMAPQQMDEVTFVNEVVRSSGAKLLLDVNNVYVNSRNHNFDPFAYLDQIEQGSVQQIHLSGHTDNGDHVIDTHDQAVTKDVFELYRHAITRLGPVPTLIERDDNIPSLSTLVGELNYARQVATSVFCPTAATDLPGVISNAPATTRAEHAV